MTRISSVQRFICTGALAALAITGMAATATAEEGPAGPAYLDKIDSALWSVRGGNDSAITTARRNDVKISRAERAIVDVYVSGSVADAVRKLQGIGMSVAATASQPENVVEGWIPVEQLGAAAELGVTDSVMSVAGGGTDSGSVQCQCVVAHNVDDALAAGANSGAGVDVGVISDSMNQVGAGVAGSQATGDLPANTVVLKDDAGSSDEGRAMAEIVFDEAPGISKLMFASGTVVGAVDKADSINKLVANGADVIADDIFYIGEPMFQDSTVSAAVDNARAAGVLYFASSGNRGSQSWEGTYSNSASFNDFDPGAGVDTVQTLATIPAGQFIQVALDWDEPLGGVTTDLDALLRTSAGGLLPGAAPTGGINVSTTTGRAIEVVTWSNTSGSPVAVGLQIQRSSGTRSPFMKTIVRRNSGGFTIAEYDTGSNTINPDAAASNGAITVAAVDAADSGLNTPETYSSRGPITRLFDAAGNRLATPDVRVKPELAATDKVSTSVPGFAPFGGTSAAAPSAAGIAAVLRSSNPNATLAEIEAQMTDPLNAIACTSASPINDCGAGFLLADRAFANLDKTGPVVTAKTTPSKPNGKNGWYTKPVTVNWNVTDDESPVDAGCASSGTVSKDGKTTLACTTAHSGGGPNSAQIVVKLDRKPPTKPKVKGFKATTYKVSKLPKRSKIKCRSKDATSGLASCKVKGYSKKPGKHTLVATATDKAGLKAVKKLKYKVVG